MLLGRYLKALFSKWWFSAITILSFGSTVSSYLPAYFPHFMFPKWVPLFVLAVAWFVASFLVFAEQESKTEALIDELESLKASRPKRAELAILGREALFFRLMHGHNRGVYGIAIKLNMIIENQGDRHSTVDSFDLAIKELDDQGPYERVALYYEPMLHTPKSSVAINQSDKLAPNGVVIVEAEKTAGPGYLMFFLDAIPRADCHVLHCILTVHDTQGSSASCEFVVREYPLS